jgi:glycine cleavage system H protein
MVDTPKELGYRETHEWVRNEGDGTVTVGITDYAQDSLGDIVYVELPELGDELDLGQEAGVVESVKAASEVFAPLTGTVIAIN